MKFNWGHKILLVFIAFVAMMFTLVYKSMKTDFDLVSKEYYKDELAFQEVIDGKNNALALSTPSNVSIEEKDLVIQLPEEMKNTNLKGSIWFYCPVDASFDKKMDLATDKDARQLVAISGFQPANYIVKLQWNVDGKKYYSEQAIRIN